MAKAGKKQGGQENLRTDFTREERAANGAKGGVASGESKRRMKTFRETLRALLDCDLSDDGQRRALEELGFAPTYMNQINLSGIKRAAMGDIEAARFIRDTIGEKPRDGLDVGLEGRITGGLDLSALTDDELRAMANEEDHQA